MADGEKKFLSRDEILAAVDVSYEDVYMEKWGGYVRLRSLTASERDRFEASLRKQVGKREVKNLENVRAKLVATVATDDQNQKLFTGANDQKLLGEKNAAELNTLFERACKLSGITDDDVKDLEGNSDEEDGTTSSSD